METKWKIILTAGHQGETSQTSPGSKYQNDSGVSEGVSSKSNHSVCYSLCHKSCEPWPHRDERNQSYLSVLEPL